MPPRQRQYDYQPRRAPDKSDGYEQHPVEQPEGGVAPDGSQLDHSRAAQGRSWGWLDDVAK